jgi:hypothetical protein
MDDAKEKTDKLKPLEVTEESFLTLIKKGAVYVDKTDKIHELVKSRGPYFLSRPRRFGKSLLVDTIQQLFQGRRELFAGLKIEKKEPLFSWEPYPVIRINMNRVGPNPDRFEDNLVKRLARIAGKFKVEISMGDVSDAFDSLVTSLSEKFENSIGDASDITDKALGNVVLLIDEYDFPLLKNMEDPIKVEKIREKLYDFYSAVKGCINDLRFVFITGITKFRELSFFSALNNIDDITFDKNFAAICGFTENDITSYFDGYLPGLLSEQIKCEALLSDSRPSALIDKITSWYDGYSWDGKTKVFNPYSIKKLLQKNEFGDYWYESGTPLFTGHLESFDATHFKISNKNISVDEPVGIHDTSNIDDESFLLQAGYLTVDSIVKTEDSKTYMLKIPNFEIKNAINKELSNKFKKFLQTLDFMKIQTDMKPRLTSMKNELLNALLACDIDKSEMLLSSIFSGIPKKLYRKGGENLYHIILLIILRFGGTFFSGDILSVIPELLSDAGLSDLVLPVPGKGYIVIELKYIEDKETARPQPDSGKPDEGETPTAIYAFTRSLPYGEISEKVKRLLENAVDLAFKQILSNNYAKQYLVSGLPIIAAVIAVYGTSAVMARFGEAVWKNGTERMICEIKPKPGSEG